MVIETDALGQRGEVLTSPQGGRSVGMAPRLDALETARCHDLTQAHLLAWRDRFLTGGQAAVKTRHSVTEQGHKRRIHELERRVRQFTLENQILRKSNELIPPTEAQDA